MSSPREDFLKRVRQAVNAGNRPGAASDMPEREGAGYQGAGTNSIQRFREELVALGGWFHLVPDSESCVAKVVEIIETKTPNRVLLGKGPVIDPLGLAKRLQDAEIALISLDQLEPESCREPFFAADIGISGVDYLIAETGTVVLHSGPDQPRSVSLLPPVHIAIAERKQLVGDLFDLFPSSDRAQSPTLPSCITLITGPSKTGDIEMRLVTGVHGPGEIHVILMDR
jgi:L-lactate dehydrogenase complex protein LldG